MMVIRIDSAPGGRAPARLDSPLDIVVDDAAHFRGRIRGHVAGELVFAEVSAIPHRADGTVRARAEAYYKVLVPVRGSCLLSQAGRQVRLGTNDVAVLDTAQPYSVLFDAACRLQVAAFPRRVLRLPTAGVEASTATVLARRHPATVLLSTLLSGMTARTGELGTIELLRLADIVVDLVATVLAAHADEDPAATAVAQQAVLPRVKAFLEDHLDDPDLSPAMAAEAAHLSVGYLHKLFRVEGTTVCGWIRQRRLEHCRADLTDPALYGLAVGAVAARRGFVDAAHFSRLFKLTYGVPPREYRILNGRGNFPGG
ncbi:putative AraC family transcriptional regulator [Nocardia brasiliensis NBRC 14402]|nr:AraC family transcriptional regulator [Nocardia brasiliensis]GAJ80963.1 putative AraC family transcriptional regulator [Nocardia brasiliensis NBRC 14402]